MTTARLTYSIEIPPSSFSKAVLSITRVSSDLLPTRTPLMFSYRILPAATLWTDSLKKYTPEFSLRNSVFP